MQDAGAVLAVWTDADPAQEADFNEWYNREHLGERAAIPGFLDGRRYHGATARTRPRYLALYDTAGTEVLDSAPYRQRLDNPSPWTMRIMPAFRNVTRAVLRIDGRFGIGHGGAVATIRPRRPGALAPAAREWLLIEVLAAVVREPGMISADLLSAAGSAVAPSTTEGRMRPAPDAGADWAIVVEGGDAAAVRNAVSRHLPPATLQARGAGDVLTGIYRMAACARHIAG